MTRIHLDNVEGLGAFLDIEASVSIDEAAAKSRINWLFGKLAFTLGDCIRASYVDLISADETAS